MTKQQFRRIQKILSFALKEAEEDAKNEGIDIFSLKYEELVLALRKKILENFELTPKQYEELRLSFKPVKKPVSYKEIVDIPELPKAIKGDKGDVGLMGKKGLDGQSGHQGIQGIQGAPGEPGKHIERVDKDLTDQLRLDMAELQLARSDLWKRYMELEKLLPDIEKWKILTGGKIADGLHQHDFRQRRGYGGVDADTVRKLIADNPVVDSFSVEDLSSQCDGSNTAFATNYTIGFIFVVDLNGTVPTYTKTDDKEITLDIAPDSGEELSIIYLKL